MMTDAFCQGAVDVKGTGTFAVLHNLGVEPTAATVKGRASEPPRTFWGRLKAAFHPSSAGSPVLHITHVDANALVVKTYPANWRGTVVWRVDA